MYKIGHHGLSCSYFYKADEKHLTVAPPQNNKKGTSACFAYLQLVGLKKNKLPGFSIGTGRKNLTRQCKSNIVMNKYLRLCPSPSRESDQCTATNWLVFFDVFL